MIQTLLAHAQKPIPDVQEYDREIPGWVVSLAFFSTFASTNTYIGQAGKAFQFGLSWAWAVAIALAISTGLCPSTVMVHQP